MRTLFVVAVAAVAAGVSRECTTDADCSSEEFCKQEVSGSSASCAETKVCVQRGGLGMMCGPPRDGLPCFRVECQTHLKCEGGDRGRCIGVVPRTCTPYTEAPQCLAPLCYNVGECMCGRWREQHVCGDMCAQAPECDPGFECKTSNCGGCFFQCVKKAECCQAAPTCRAGFEQTRAETCTQQMWDSNICVRETLCCKEIVCRTSV